MSSLGSLVVSLSANTAQYTSDLGRAAHISAQRMGQIQKSAKQAGLAIGAAFVAGVGTAAVLVRNAINSADAMAKMSQQAGVSVEAFSTLAYAAKLSGVEAQALQASMSRLSGTMYDIAQGSGEDAKIALKTLGVSATDASGKIKNADQIMIDVADRFKGMEDGAGKTALAIKIFGQSGAQLIPMLNSGADGIRKMQQEARDLGAEMDGPTAAAAEQFNDNLTRLNTLKEGFANQIMRAMLPSLNGLTDSLIGSAKASGGLADAAGTAATGMKILITVGAVAVGVFQTLGQIIGGVAASITQFVTGNFAGAFKTATDTIYDYADNIGKTAARINAIWNTEAGKAESSAAKNGKKFATPLNKGAKEAEASAKRIKQMLLDLQRQYDGLGKTDKEQSLLKFTELNAGAAQKKQAAAILDLIEAKKGQIEVEKALGAYTYSEKARLQDKRLEIELMGKTAIEQQRLSESRRIDFELQDKIHDLEQKRAEQGLTLSAGEIAMFQARAAAAKQASLALIDVKYQKDADPWFNFSKSIQEYGEVAASVGKQVGDATANAMKTMEDSLVKFVTTGKLDFKSLANSIIADVARIQIKSMLSGIFGGATGGGGILSGVMSMFTGGAGSSTASANGNAFMGGRVAAFANGGAFTNSIANQPTLAPMALFGEAGAEAIMPLSRDASGRLGVQSSGGGSTSVNFAPVINIDSRTDRAEVVSLVTRAMKSTKAELVDDLSRRRLLRAG